MKTGFSLCGKTTQGKPCSGPVRDCSVHTGQKILKIQPSVTAAAYIRQQKETEDKLVLTDRPQMTKNDLKTVLSKSSTDNIALTC
jgi:hypothetical protein